MSQQKTCDSVTPGRHRWRFSSVSVLNSYFSFALLRGFYLHLSCSILYFPPQSSENLPHFTSHGFLPPVRLTRASPILNVKVTLRGTQSLSYKATASPLNSTFIGLRVFFFFFSQVCCSMSSRKTQSLRQIKANRPRCAAGKSL